MANLRKEDPFHSKDKEWLYQYCQSVLRKEKIDFFIFGHRHLPLDLEIEGTATRYINLGEWVTGDCHYAHFDGENIVLKVFP